MTFGRNILPGPHYGEGKDALLRLLADLATIVGAEAHALKAEGATFIQVDEPGYAAPPEGIDVNEGVQFINAALEGLGEAGALHVCFGNNASRPYAPRNFARLFPGLGEFNCKTLLLEFANREMADVERLAGLAERHAIAAGVVDVNSYHEETAEQVAERIRLVLQHVPAERLIVTADCGFSAIPRFLARIKLNAMVAGTRLVRQELGG